MRLYHFLLYKSDAKPFLPMISTKILCILSHQQRQTFSSTIKNLCTWPYHKYLHWASFCFFFLMLISVCIHMLISQPHFSLIIHLNTKMPTEYSHCLKRPFWYHVITIPDPGDQDLLMRQHWSKIMIVQNNSNNQPHITFNEKVWGHAIILWRPHI